MNLLKIYVGSGILALPYVFNQGGYFLTAILMCFASYMNFQSLNYLIKIARHYNNKDTNYIELAERVLGKKSFVLLKIFFVINQIGCCISYIIFFLKFFEYVFDTEGNRAASVGYLFLAIAIIIPLSFINNIQVFVKYSRIANLFIMISLLLIVGQELYDIGSEEDFKEGNVANFKRIPFLLGVCVYSFEGASLVLTIRAQADSKQMFQALLQQIQALVTILYILFSTFGVLAFGDNINEIVIFSL